jgi:hypothetical protein
MFIKHYFQIIAFIFFFYNTTNLYGQKEKFNSSIYDFLPPKGAILKAYPNFHNFSYKDYLNYLDTLKYSDQYYRIILVNQGYQDPKGLTKPLKPNDCFNAKVLLMLIKKFGWPCSKDLNKSYTAFLVVWHQRNEPNIYMEFEPYVKIAHQKKCIDAESFKMLNDLFTKGEINYN